MPRVPTTRFQPPSRLGDSQECVRGSQLSVIHDLLNPLYRQLLNGLYFSIDGNFKMVHRAARPSDRPDNTVIGAAGFWVGDDQRKDYLSAAPRVPDAVQAGQEVRVRLRIVPRLRSR